ncbi:protein S40-6-like [Primulina huaijiensis]|uniref:protein S40-6-like n=1 Tax=Primulina huaijiensis TaxID=1492673 RepID=UPI003CC6ED30
MNLGHFKLQFSFSALGFATRNVFHGGFSSWLGNYSGGRMIKAALDEGDLQEDEVWSVMKTTEGSKSNSNSKTRKKVSPASAWRSAVAISSRGGDQTEDLAADFVTQHSSALIDIPDWSKTLKMKSKENLWDDDDDACYYPNDHESDDGDQSKTHHVKNDDDVDDDQMVPPHEYLARKLASTQIASFSMCEGVGRTLKGRDLSKMRNAILTKTGFLG